MTRRAGHGLVFQAQSRNNTAAGITHIAAVVRIAATADVTLGVTTVTVRRAQPPTTTVIFIIKLLRICTSRKRKVGRLPNLCVVTHVPTKSVIFRSCFLLAEQENLVVRRRVAGVLVFSVVKLIRPSVRVCAFGIVYYGRCCNAIL